MVNRAQHMTSQQCVSTDFSIFNCSDRFAKFQFCTVLYVVFPLFSVFLSFLFLLLSLAELSLQCQRQSRYSVPSEFAILHYEKKIVMLAIVVVCQYFCLFRPDLHLYLVQVVSILFPMSSASSSSSTLTTMSSVKRK